MPLYTINHTRSLRHMHIHTQRCFSTSYSVVVTQLVERSLPTPEVNVSNPGIGKIYIEHFLSTGLKRRK